MRSRRVGPATFRRLMEAHSGDAEAALAALPRIAGEAGVTDYFPCSEADARREWQAAMRLGAVPIWFGAPDYPALLAGTEDAPPLLWALGRVALLARPAVALVGARNASSLGLRMAAALARDLGAAGVAVVSGLARGIDTAAHEASLATGAIAVVAGGPDIAYPRENAALMDRIAAEGLLLSEMPPGLRPQGRHFPRRNRIVSGLSRGVVVVEAAPRSGSLITAREAADQGREVMAVPGHPFDARASGCNLLIRDGATLVRGAADVLAACALPDPPDRHRSRPAAATAPAGPGAGSPPDPRTATTEGSAPAGRIAPSHRPPPDSRTFTTEEGPQRPPPASRRPPRLNRPVPGDAAPPTGRARFAVAPDPSPCSGGATSVACPDANPVTGASAASEAAGRTAVEASTVPRPAAPPRLLSPASTGSSAPSPASSARATGTHPSATVPPTSPCPTAPPTPARSAARHLSVPQAPATAPRPSPAPVSATAPRPDAIARQILDRLSLAPIAEDALLHDIACPAPAMAEALLSLELDGRVARQPGGLLCRTA